MMGSLINLPKSTVSECVTAAALLEVVLGVPTEQTIVTQVRVSYK